MLTISSFRSEHGFLSNFFERPVTIGGITYPTNEHGFHAHKSLDTQMRLWIASQPTPGEAKRAGRQLELRPDWDQVRKQVMLALQLAKYTQHLDLGAMLTATGNAMLIEGNDWHDNFWGVCSCAACQAKGLHGYNYLGVLLMATRAVVRPDVV